MTFFTSEQLSAHLPTYLSESAKRVLAKDLEQFSDNNNPNKFYVSPYGINELRQGDLFTQVEMLIYPDKTFEKASAVLLTNSCSAAIENKRALPPYLTFAPLIDFSKMERKFEASKLKEFRESHLANVIYFPPSGKYEKGTLALLDRTFSIPLNSDVTDSLLKNRISTLSTFGWYFFIFKLSYWYCRMGEKIERDSPIY